MPWLLLADSVVVIHLCFVLFVIAGGLPVLRWPRLAWLHLPAVIWGTLSEFGHVICPLTYLENYLRGLAGAARYHGDFVAHYLIPILYPAQLTPHIQIALGIVVLVLNALIYSVWWRRLRRDPPETRSPR